ncbi:SARP family transcriptional regulator, partial [Mesorhizobium sp. B2-6-6]
MRTLRGLGALALLLALLIGIPVALIALGGNPIPDPDALRQALTGVDYGGRVLMGTILPLIGWAAWASFAVSVVVELVAQARNVRAPQLKGLGAQQALAGGLVAAVLAIGGGAPAMAQDAPAASAGPGAGSASVSQVLDQPSSGADSTEQAGTYTVREGDTLAGIARTQLGDESRWGELAEDMRGVEQSDGRSLQDPNLIYTGWEVPLNG